MSQAQLAVEQDNLLKAVSQLHLYSVSMYIVCLLSMYHITYTPTNNNTTDIYCLLLCAHNNILLVLYCCTVYYCVYSTRLTPDATPVRGSFPLLGPFHRAPQAPGPGIYRCAAQEQQPAADHQRAGQHRRSHSFPEECQLVRTTAGSWECCA